MAPSRMLHLVPLPVVVIALVAVASADYLGVEAEIIDTSDGLVTWRVYAAFDNPDDYLVAVGEAHDYALSFLAPQPLVNDGGVFAGLQLEDTAQAPISGPRDTWVTIGAEEAIGNGTTFSANFLEGDGVHSVVVGSKWCDDYGGWYDGDQFTTPVHPVDGRVLIAQFTFPGDGGATGFRLAGDVTWAREHGTPLIYSPFTVVFGDSVSFCDGDVDWDGTVGFADLIRVVSEWGLCSCCEEDIDYDGIVGQADLIAVLSNWGSCS